MNSDEYAGYCLDADTCQVGNESQYTFLKYSLNHTIYYYSQHIKKVKLELWMTELKGVD